MTRLPHQAEPLEEETRFNFRCHPGVDCFTECCRELELALSPYDALRLRRNLGLSAQEFMERHAVVEFTPDDPYPQVYLAMLDDGRASCPFVGPEGCRVYPDRPAACRAYPLGRGVSLRPDGQRREHLVLVREDHCRGFAEPRPQTAQDWQQDQGLAEYNAASDRLLALLTGTDGRLRRLSVEEGELYLDQLYRLPPETGLEEALYRLDQRWRTPR